jgi:hypothetical protein
VKPHDRVVEVFTPSQAPHLARIATEVETQLLRHIETLPTDGLSRLLREGYEIEHTREEFERFLRRAGVS